MNSKKTHFNPIVGDIITFVETSRETNGRTTLAELILKPFGKGTPPHYHDRINETFTVLEGELTVRLNNELHVLTRGQGITVPIGTKHCFYNSRAEPVKALIKFEPGSEGVENSIIIAYGLARDGHCDKNGIPRRLDHLSILMDLSEGRVPGILSLMMPLLKIITWWARRRGVEKVLMRKYL